MDQGSKNFIVRKINNVLYINVVVYKSYDKPQF